MQEPMSTGSTAVITPPADNQQCPPWCYGDCGDWSDKPGTLYHGSDPLGSVLAVDSHEQGKVDFAVVTNRLDENFTVGAAQVHLVVGDLGGDDYTLTPAIARKLAAMLLNGADAADPVPPGVLLISAAHLRVGDELLTAHGWQTVRGLMFLTAARVFTDERNADDTDGWEYAPTDSVQVRRPVHPTQEAGLTGWAPELVSAVGWCSRCRAKRKITGKRTVSVTGVARIRGKCATCSKSKQNALIASDTMVVAA